MPNKPEPLFIDGHYHYTLSSYDPVEATLTIPHLTDEEVGYGIAGIVAERGWKEDGLPTDAWVAENVEGLGTLDELKQAVREELEQINARYVASTKGGLCAEELAKRVEQRVPAAIVERARDIVRQGFEMQAAQNGVALAQLLARRDALGWVGSTVTSLTQGYLPSDQAGTGIRFVPVWLVETDAGSFFINGITREITAEK